MPKIHDDFCCCFSGSLFTNSNWFAFEEERVIHEQSTSAVASPSPNTDDTAGSSDDDDVDASKEIDKDCVDPATSEVPESKPGPDDTAIEKSTDDSTPSESDKPPEWIEWRESVKPSTEPLVMTAESVATSQGAVESLPNGDLEVIPQADIADGDDLKTQEVSPPSSAMDKSEPEDNNGGKTDSSATEKPEAVADISGKTDIGGSPPE